jgi:hypothetical protein
MTPDQLKNRNLAIRAAWDDPLRRALLSAKKSKSHSKRSNQEAFNAYYREYRKRRANRPQKRARRMSADD